MPKSRKRGKKMNPEKLKLIQEMANKKAGFGGVGGKGVASNQISDDKNSGAVEQVKQLKNTKKGDR